MFQLCVSCLDFVSFETRIVNQGFVGLIEFGGFLLGIHGCFAAHIERLIECLAKIVKQENPSSEYGDWNHALE